MHAHVLTQPLSILQYAATLARLRPKDFLQQAISDSIVYHLYTVTENLNVYFKCEDIKEKRLVAKKVWEEIKKSLLQLDSYLRPFFRKGYSVSETLTYADIMIYATVKLLHQLPVIPTVANDLRNHFKIIPQVIKHLNKLYSIIFCCVQGNESLYKTSRVNKTSIYSI